MAAEIEAWTKEPWKVTPFKETAKRIALEQDYGENCYGGPALAFVNADDTVDGPGNAARIVACVNACAGMAVPSSYLAALREVAEAATRVAHLDEEDHDTGQWDTLMDALAKLRSEEARRG